MRAFLATAEEGSLSGAARVLKSSQPTVGRQVSALEAELGLALFERVGARLELTPGGIELLRHAEAMREAAVGASMTASGRSEAIEGSICLSVGEHFAATILPTIIEKLRTEEPGIEIEIVASNEASDLRRREADIAFRSQTPGQAGLSPSQPDLIAARLGALKTGLYASPAYLDRIGRPRMKTDMSRAHFIDFDDSGVYRAYLNQLGFELSPRHFPVRTASHLVQWALAKSGVGVAATLQMIGEADPDMERVLPDFAMERSMWLVTHRELKTSRRIRHVFDFLYRELKAVCAGQG